jgi:hypothetical protein
VQEQEYGVKFTALPVESPNRRFSGDWKSLKTPIGSNAGGFFNDVVPARGNKAFYRFRKPLNAKGKWKLQVREVLTGCTKTVELP